MHQDTYGIIIRKEAHPDRSDILPSITDNILRPLWEVVFSRVVPQYFIFLGLLDVYKEDLLTNVYFTSKERPPLKATLNGGLFREVPVYFFVFLIKPVRDMRKPSRQIMFIYLSWETTSHLRPPCQMVSFHNFLVIFFDLWCIWGSHLEI